MNKCRPLCINVRSGMSRYTNTPVKMSLYISDMKLTCVHRKHTRMRLSSYLDIQEHCKKC